jgi:CheY-like chemotaxis protein
VHHVLVVDDDPLIREVVAEMLDLEGYAVETAANGQEALAAVRRSEPRVVLLDMRMPVLDGWGFAQAIHQRGQQLPIVVMTAAHDAARWARDVGAQRVLPKPFELADLLSAVRGCASAT